MFKYTVKHTTGISAFLLASLLIDALPLCAPAARAARSNDNISITFPSESIGQLSLLRPSWRPGSVSHSDLVPLGPARGVLTVPRQSALKLVGNYALADSLRSLDGLPAGNIIALDLRKLPLTNGQLAPISRLKSLRHLSLEATEVSDGALKHMANLKSLQYLSLKSTLFTGAAGQDGIKNLAHISSLRQLRIGHNELSKCDFRPFVALKNLATLQLSCSQINDAALAQIGSLTWLDSLDISGNNKLTDKGLLHLSRIKHLRHLDLSDLKVSSRGICALAPMRIKFLSLYFRDYKPAELAQIKKCLVGTKILDACKREIPPEVYAPLH